MVRNQYAMKAVRRRERRVERLSEHLPRVGLPGVLADLDRDARPCEVPGEAAGDGLTWEARDADDTTWWPQGVTTTGSADVLLVSWYAKRHHYLFTQGSRISVVDRSDPARPRYRHVLLVAGRRRPLLSLGAVPVHAGGIAVLGNLLYVADTITGVRIFRLDDVLRVPRRGRPDARLPWARPGTRRLGRRLTGGYTTYGYEYVLPQLMSLNVPLLAGRDRLLYSFLSVGDVDGALSLVVGEYRRKGSSPRLVRYLLDPATGLPAPGADGRCAPVEFHDAQPPRMQGVAVDGSTWYVSASSGEGKPGDLHVGRPGAFRHHRGVLPPGPEDLDWSRPGEELWCVTEWPGHRFVFPIDATRWSSPPLP